MANPAKVLTWSFVYLVALVALVAWRAIDKGRPELPGLPTTTVTTRPLRSTTTRPIRSTTTTTRPRWPRSTATTTTTTVPPRPGPFLERLECKITFGPGSPRPRSSRYGDLNQIARNLKAEAKYVLLIRAHISAEGHQRDDNYRDYLMLATDRVQTVKKFMRNDNIDADRRVRMLPPEVHDETMDSYVECILKDSRDPRD